MLLIKKRVRLLFDITSVADETILVAETCLGCHWWLVPKSRWYQNHLATTKITQTIVISRGGISGEIQHDDEGRFWSGSD